MGEVYRARDTRLGRAVAIKVLPSHLSSNPDLKTRFEREARAISALSHPHLPLVRRRLAGMELTIWSWSFLEGESLAWRLQKVRCR
jgi:serine/threonine protein kinase